MSIVLLFYVGPVIKILFLWLNILIMKWPSLLIARVLSSEGIVGCVHCTASLCWSCEFVLTFAMSLFFSEPIIIASVYMYMYVCLPCCGNWAYAAQKIHVQILTGLPISMCLPCCGLEALWADAVIQVQILAGLPHPAWWMPRCSLIGGLSLWVVVQWM